jgi:hypothetical protein
MGLVQSFTPGSIKTVWDMRRAIELVLIDLFDDVGSTGCSEPDRIAFETDGADGLCLEIVVVDHTEGPGLLNLLGEDERKLLRAFDASMLSIGDALARLSGSTTVEPDDQGEAESSEGEPSDVAGTDTTTEPSSVDAGTTTPSVTTADFNDAVGNRIGPAIAELISATAGEDSAFDVHAAQEERREKANAALAKLVQRLQACFEEDIALAYEGQLLRIEPDDEGTPHCRFSRLISVD